MDATDVLRAERAVYYAMLGTLAESGVPRELWPVVADSAAGRIKDDAITALVARGGDKEADDGEHPAGD